MFKWRILFLKYLAHVKRWFDALLPIIQPLMYENGGPILMLQIENEYGSMGICDKIYLAWLAHMLLVFN